MLVTRTLFYTFGALACTVYAVNILLCLAASTDARLSPLRGVQTLAKVSIFPLQYVATTSGGLDSKYGPGTPAAFQGFDRKVALLIVSVLDAAAMLTLLVVLAWFRRRVAAEMVVLDSKTATLNDFTAVVYGLPREADLSPDEVKAFIESAAPGLKGQVATVYIGETIGRMLQARTARGALVEQLEEVNARVASTQKPAAKEVANLRLELAKAEQRVDAAARRKRNAVCAFVTFTTCEKQTEALHLWPAGFFRWLIPALTPREKRFRGKHALRMREAPAPDAVLWENLHVPLWKRQIRQGVAGFCTFALLLITTGFIIGAKEYEKEMPPDVSCTGIQADDLLRCDSIWNLTSTRNNSDSIRLTVNSLAARQSVRTCDNYVSATTSLWTANWTVWADSTRSPAPILSAYVGSPVVQCAAKVCQGCYCQNNGLWSWLEDTNGLYSYCSVFWKNYIYQWVLKGLSIVSVIVINAMLAFVIPLLARFEKLHSRGALAISIAVKTFLAAFFNAFVVTLLVYAFIRDLATFPLVFKGAFADFTPTWYASVGSSLVITTFTQAIQPPIVTALVGSISKMLQKGAIKKAFTQRSLDAVLAGPEWLLPLRVAQVLTPIALALVLCGGFPGAALLLACGTGLSFKADLYILLRVARRPLRLDGVLVGRLADLLTWCIWLHFGLSAWMFGTDSMPRWPLGKFIGSGASKYASAASSGQFNVGGRLATWATLVQAVPFFVLTLWLFVIQPFAAPILGGIFRAFVPLEESVHREELELQDIIASGRLEGLHSYDPMDNPAYASALSALSALSAEDAAAVEALEEKMTGVREADVPKSGHPRADCLACGPDRACPKHMEAEGKEEPPAESV